MDFPRDKAQCDTGREQAGAAETVQEKSASVAGAGGGFEENVWLPSSRLGSSRAAELGPRKATGHKGMGPPCTQEGHLDFVPI